MLYNNPQYCINCTINLVHSLFYTLERTKKIQNTLGRLKTAIFCFCSSCIKQRNVDFFRQNY